MIYPIVIYGSPVLRKVAQEIDKDYPNFDEFLENMWETMYYSDGVGLAAPQVGKSIRLFIIDAAPFAEHEPELEHFKKTFINAKLVDKSDEVINMDEGCLSIPLIREDVVRPEKIRVQYYDENFEIHDEWFGGMAARVIQHEYDHTEGIMFTDKVAPIKKRLLKGKLQAITKGKFNVEYKVKLPR